MDSDPLPYRGRELDKRGRCSISYLDVQLGCLGREHSRIKGALHQIRNAERQRRQYEERASTYWIPW